MHLFCNATSNWITQTFATAYPAIYCRKQFDVINYVAFHLMTHYAACNAPICDQTEEVH